MADVIPTKIIRVGIARRDEGWSVSITTVERHEYLHNEVFPNKAQAVRMMQKVIERKGSINLEHWTKRDDT